MKSLGQVTDHRVSEDRAAPTLALPSIIPLTEVRACLASLTTRIPAKNGRAVTRGNPRTRQGGAAREDNMEEVTTMTTTEGTFCLQRILGFFLRPLWRGRGWWDVSVGFALKI